MAIGHEPLFFVGLGFTGLAIIAGAVYMALGWIENRRSEVLILRTQFRVNTVAEALMLRFQDTGELDDANQAIATLQQVVKSMDTTNAMVTATLFNLGRALYHRYKRTSNPSDIDEAILVTQKALQLTPGPHILLPQLLDNLGNSFMRRFERCADLSDIDQAITTYRRAVGVAPQNRLYMSLSNLGSALASRFDHTGELTSIAEAIDTHQRAVALTAESHEHMLALLDALGSALQSRFRRHGDVRDIAEAISTQRRVVKLTPEGSSDFPRGLNRLGGLLTQLFECASDVRREVIAEAIATRRKAVEVTAEGCTSLPVRLADLGVSLRARFVRTGSMLDIEEAIAQQQRAMSLIPDAHKDAPVVLNNLGISLQARYDRTFDLADLAENISVMQNAVQRVLDGDARLPELLSNLGLAYGQRYERIGVNADLVEAVTSLLRAVDLAPEGHAELPSLLSNLGSLLLSTKFKRNGDSPAIVEAVSILQRAVSLTPKGHADLPGRLHNLGIALLQRFERSGDLPDIVEAISAQERGLLLTPEGDANQQALLNSLGNSYIRSFERTAELSDISQAIHRLQKAVEITPEGHGILPEINCNLGLAFYRRLCSFHGSEDLVTCLSHFRCAATSPAGSPGPRLVAALRWARALRHHIPESPEVVPVFETVLRLITVIAGVEQTVDRRYAQHQRLSGLALEAAAIAFQLGKIGQALEFLEQGRCFVWSQLHNLRTPLDDLRAQYPELAQNIVDVAGRLESAGLCKSYSSIGSPLSEKITMQDQARVHLADAKRWDELVSEARSKPGFDTLLQPSPCSTLLQSLPSTGYIVVINVDESRCDAIALSASLNGPLHIPLSNFSLKKARKYSADLKGRLRLRGFGMPEDAEEPLADEHNTGTPDETTLVPDAQEPKPDQDLIRKILQGLWKSLVKPIIDALGLSKLDLSSGKRPPRVWWCPTGPLSFLPIHAAGIYFRNKAAECVLDYVVSSYTPTVTALLRRVQNDAPMDKDTRGLFLTCQPDVPDAKSIPETKREVRVVYSAAQEIGLRVLKLEGDEVSPESCLQHMENFSCVHLACHASQNAAQPLNSQFLFHTGPLNLTAIMQRSLKNADLAFLSACQTSTGEEKLPDEAVHLAAGMLAAGYRRVVATMWTIRDQHATGVSEGFYGYLWSHREKSDGDCFDGKLSAYALHHTIQKLRLELKDHKNSETALLSWIPYVHFGY